jgi:hypothetical protein
LKYAIRLCLGREVNAEERALLTKLHAEFVRECATHPRAAQELLGTGPANADATQAAWVATARTILNLDEFLTRE